ncbi:hypothetical protein [Paenibacillus glacialis]|uniref:Lipoprotein n=1 Tax=Paenibacillus glacialis TaxID=494026 RepID=A0A168K8G9_9BACL|nr:hypothetical protein [Paenibacillus glacialis]OAB41696.1 hypothetical protein PGLA_15595 [Paenibacillus glacialis]
MKRLKLYYLISLLFVTILALTACKDSDHMDRLKEASYVPQSNTQSKESDQNNSAVSLKPKPLQEDDFTISYRSEQFTKSTNIKDLIAMWGYGEGFESSNNGFISGNGEFRRWNLSYPGYGKPEIRFVVLSKIELEGEDLVDGESYLVAASIESPKITTRRGLKIGDTLEETLQIYGQPDSVTNGRLTYSKNGLHLCIHWDTSTRKIDNIFIEYNMEKSIKEQPYVNLLEEDGQIALNMEQYSIQEKQSFDTSLAGWKNVRFVSTLKNEENHSFIQAQFFLTENGKEDYENKVLYQFPEFYGNTGRMIDKVKAVAFKDLNQDGRTDIVIIADYITGVNKNGVETRPVAGVYFQKKDNKYTTLPELDKEINQTEHNRTLNNVIQYVSKQRINVN